MKIPEWEIKVSVLDTDIFLDIIDYLTELDRLNPDIGIKQKILELTEKVDRENLM